MDTSVPPKYDVGLVEGVKGYHAAERDFMWAGYRGKEIVALFVDQDDANAWLKARNAE